MIIRIIIIISIIMNMRILIMIILPIAQRLRSSEPVSQKRLLGFERTLDGHGWVVIKTLGTAASVTFAQFARST